MPQSLAKVSVHIVFSTKRRTPWLRTADLRAELYAYMATILRQLECPAMVINGMEDHVHVLCLLSRKTRIMDLVKDAKTETSKWIKRHPRGNTGFAWQAGYGVFSVSESNIPQVRSYIENQAEHHRRTTFQDEFRELCRRHRIEWDERYAWD
jgi:REP element-mobilizing transposase RayT